MNVIHTVTDLYKELDNANRRAFKELFIARYTELFKWLEKEPSDVDEIADIVIAEALLEPDPVTNYAYDTEVMRKRERCIESVDSVPTKQMKQLQIDKAMRLWAQQTAQYMDIISHKAMVKAFEDAGVKKVRWNAQNDESVCRDCRDLDMKVFPIDKIPPKPHWRCRCWLSPC